MLTNHLFSIVMCLNSVLNVKALAGPFNQEKSLVSYNPCLVWACEIFAYLRIPFVSSSRQWPPRVDTPLCTSRFTTCWLHCKPSRRILQLCNC